MLFQVIYNSKYRTDFAGLAAGKEPDNSKDMKKVAIRDELVQMHRYWIYDNKYILIQY